MESSTQHKDTKSKKYFRCAGTFEYAGRFFQGQRPCKKILAEANDKGELHAKIICPRCGYINEI